LFIFILIISNLGSTLLIVLVHVFWYPSRVIDILRSTIAYTFHSATYIHLFVIYAFSKVDDFTWGTKGL